ncbi:hypothetical protein ANN_11397 [Periplaneta americana]|uniref:Uncharacterized protein n=1 Tax=Periplaneta americana TaxID=6978 RepID=A0ABQ8T6B9_PERAM|nr:hypothetical protein ANN_11397 [Periplaneta americana]
MVLTYEAYTWILSPLKAKMCSPYDDLSRRGWKVGIALAFYAQSCGRLRWAGHVAHMGESRNAYSVLVGRSKGIRPLGRKRRRWEDNIKMDLRKVGYDGRDWINLPQNRNQWRDHARAAVNLRIRKIRVAKDVKAQMK